MKNNFKKFLAALTVFAMALALVAVPLATAKAANENPVGNGYKTGQSWWGGGSFMVGYAAESGTVKDLETQMGYWPEGGFPWWTAVVLEVESGTTWVVKEIIPADGTNDKGSIALKENRLVVTFHEDILKDTTVPKAQEYLDFFKSLKVGDKLNGLGLWQNEVAWSALAKNEDQAFFTKIESKPSTDTTPSTGTTTTPSTGTTTTPSTGSTNNVPATGDSTPVAVMASVLLAAVAMVAYGLKKRNA